MFIFTVYIIKIMDEINITFNKELPLQVAYMIDGKAQFIYYNKISVVKTYTKTKDNELLVIIAKRYASIKNIQHKLTRISVSVYGDDFIKNEKKLMIQWLEKP